MTKIDSRRELTKPIKLTYIFLPNEIYGSKLEERIFYDAIEYETAIRTINENPERYEFIKSETVSEFTNK